MQAQFKISDHILDGARLLASPNQDARPDGEVISLLVIHNISLPPGCFGGCHVDELFCNSLDPDADPFFAEISELRVSSHLFIDRSGSITQYVPFDRRAWHAGKSRYRDRVACNDFSIGIELEGTDTVAFTDTQYESLINVAATIIRAYPTLSHQSVVGHCDIAPERKTDPGPCFDWARLRQGLAESLQEHAE